MKALDIQRHFEISFVHGIKLENYLKRVMIDAIPYHQRVAVDSAGSCGWQRALSILSLACVRFEWLHLKSAAIVEPELSIPAWPVWLTPQKYPARPEGFKTFTGESLSHFLQGSSEILDCRLIVYLDDYNSFIEKMVTSTS